MSKKTTSAKEWVMKTNAIGLQAKANLLNVALFGQTVAQWCTANPNKDGNMRDHASLEQLLVLANIENMNAKLICICSVVQLLSQGMLQGCGMET